MNPVVHFEMPFEDRQRMVDFYAKAFGWQAQLMGPEMGSYAVMTTTEMDPVTKFPTKQGRINGGFFPKSEENKIPSVVVGVEDIQAAVTKVKEAGGQILGEPVEIPGVGMYVSFIDTEGNRASMLQPTGM
jgi:uncharacterized protein